MWSRELGEPISSSGLAMNVSRSNGSSPSSPRIALIAYSPAEQPRLHVGHARPVGDPIVDPERTGRRGAGIEDGVHVADQQHARPVRACRVNVPTTVSPELPRRVGSDVDLGAEPLEERGRPAPDLVDPLGRVRPAVDVHEPLEVVEVGAAVGRDRRAQRVELEARRSAPVVSVGHDGSLATTSCCYPAGTVRVVEIRLLEGPNVYRLEPVVKVELAVGRRRTWYGQRDPGRHALVRLGAAVPARDWPDPVAAIVAWVRRLRARPRRGARRAGRPPIVRPGSLDHHLPVERRGAGTHPDRGGPRAGRARRVALADRAAHRRAGAAARPLDRADRSGTDDARRPGSATPTGGCRPSRSPARTASRPSRG